MAKYYGGVQFPDLPSEIAKLPYIIIKKNLGASSFQVIGCSGKFWYNPNKTSETTNALDQSSGSMSYANITQGSEVWGAVYTGNYYTTFDYIVWSNYDVPSDSSSASNVYHYGSQPTLTPIHLVNKWNASIGNDVFELNLTLNGCTPGNMLVLAYAVRDMSNVVTLPDGWTLLGGSNNIDNKDNINQRIMFAYKKATGASESISIKQTIGKRMYAICSEYTGVDTVRMRNDMAAIGMADYTVVGSKPTATDIILYAVTSSYYGSGRQQTVSPADLDKLEGDEGAERLACWFDGGLGATSHTFTTYVATAECPAVLECVQLLERPPSICICGNVVGHSVPQSDYAQEDPKHASYIKNKPPLGGYVTSEQLNKTLEQALAGYPNTDQLNTIIQQALGDYVTASQLESAIQEAVLDSWEEAY